MSYTVPNNLVSQYNAGQRQADPSKIDENFNYCTDALDEIDTLVTTAAAEGVDGIAQIATQVIAEAGTDDSNKFLNALKGKYLVQALVNAVGNLGTSNALTAPVAWANQITGGAYYVPSNAGNTGGPSTDAYHLIVTRYGDSDVAQLAFPAVANSQPSWRVKIGGTWGSWAPFVPGGTQFATSTTASATADKVAALSNYALSNGSRVFVTFSNANTVAGALTLNVNGTGAKSIYNELGAVSATNPATFTAGVPVEFIYDGTNWTYRKYQDEFAKVSGGAPMYTCRAWVNFNGTGVISTRGSGNVTSVTDMGTGLYKVSTSLIPDDHYCISTAARPTSDYIAEAYIAPASLGGMSASSFIIRTAVNGAAADCDIVCASVFR